MDDDTTLPRPPGTGSGPAGHSTTLSPPRTSSVDGLPPGRVDLHLPRVDPDRYVVGGIVAEGGHGRILRAEDRYLERTVALKEPLEPGGFAEARFLTEARLTARLQHPSIVPLYEAGRWPGGAPFYAMKLVSGRSLDGLIAATPLLDGRLALLPHVLAAAEAVAYAHGQRILHRDLKPANILVGELGETFVIDWGLAKELGRAELPVAPGAQQEASRPAEQTQAGTIMGTPAYMPPEQAAGQPVDESADVYALGAILYHLLSGRPLAFSAEGRLLASGDEAGAVLLWEEGHARPREVYRHKEEVMTLAFSPEGRFLASGSMDHSVWLQPLGPGEGRRLDAGARGVLQGAFSPDGTALLCISDEDTTVLSWDVATGERGVRLWGHSRTVRHFAFSPEGSRLATASEDGTVRVWDWRSGRGRALQGHSGAVYHVAFSPDGRLIASTGQEGGVRVWPDALPQAPEALRDWLRQAARP